MLAENNVLYVYPESKKKKCVLDTRMRNKITRKKSQYFLNMENKQKNYNYRSRTT